MHINVKIVALHLLCWIGWFSVTNISYIINYKETLWVPASYSYVSLMFVFYAVHYFSLSYQKRVKLMEGIKKKKIGRWLYFLYRWEIAGILAIIFSYIVISWRVDHHFVRAGIIEAVQQDFWVYADLRFSRMSFYIFGGVTLTVIKKLLSIIKGNKEYITFMQWHTIRLRNDAKKEQQIRKQFIEKFFFNREN
jgi:hypothetical protein